MRRTAGLWLVMLGLIWAQAAAGGRSQPGFDFAREMERFERNVSLGQVLSHRAGRPEEFAAVEALAREGLAAARRAVASSPGSAEAQYLLGSWLLYGYRVVKTTQTFQDADGTQRTEVVRRVMQGLTDDHHEALEALKRATILDPARGRYLVDYGAALFDCGEPEEALAVLRSAWNQPGRLTAEERGEAALLLSRICLELWQFTEAREWAYAALGVDPANAPALDRLRQLDRAAASAEAGGETAGEGPAGELEQ